MLKIFHCSDLHCAAGETPSSVPDNNDAMAKRLLSTIVDRHFKSDPNAYLLVTGDIVDGASESQYRAAWSALAPFAGRMLACPGNHDASRMGNFYDYEGPVRWKTYIQPLCVATGDQTSHMPTETILSDGAGTRVVCYGLNSTVYGTSTSFACGELGQVQREALMSKLNRASMMDTPTIVFLHHRPFGFDWPVSATMRLKDGPELAEIVDGVVDVVAYGHSGAGLELPYGLPPNSAIDLHGTQHLDANASVRTQSYYEIVIDHGDVRVSQLRCPQ
jgi:hypothetical protein